MAKSVVHAIGSGAELVQDTNPTPDSGFTSFNFQMFNGIGYFLGSNSINGQELWRTDGTSAGTYMVRDVYPGAGSSAIVFNNPSGAISTGFFFRATTSAEGAELWFSDGTEAGTNLVKDINPSNNSSSPGMATAGCASCGLVVLNDVAYFSAFDGSNGAELWRSDGTSAGTYMVKNINTATANASSNPYNLTLFGNRFLFSATDATNGLELWISDGTTNGTTLLKDVKSGASSGLSSSVNMVVSGGFAYFAADDGTTGRELWRTDGTSAGTTLVKDIQPGTTAGSISFVTPYNGGVVFTGQDPTAGNEPFFSDGTSAGTAVIKDINPGVSSSAFGTGFSFQPVGSKLFFTAKTALNGDELWVTDATSNGTYMVADIAVGATGGITNQYVATSNGKLYFQANDLANGGELWLSDGTAGGTFMVKDVAVGITSGALYPMAFPWGVIFGGFQSATGRELWRSDGTSAGTYMVKEIATSTGSGYNIQGTIFWGCMGSKYMFHGQSKIWTTDGTSAGTAGAGTSVPNPTDLIDAGSQTFFIASTTPTGNELWRTDGTDAGTYMVKDINPGASEGVPTGFSEIVVNGILYFQATDGGGLGYGSELWRSDGTSAGTYIVKDIVAGPSGSSPRPLANVNGKLFFTVSTSTAGYELWTSDGTSAGTTMVKDINVGASSGISSFTASSIAVHNNSLYFLGNDGSTGQELWVSDGTSAGTNLVSDITPGSIGTAFGSLASAGGRMWFTATTTAAGQELWTTDGTSAGTVMVKDINPGTPGSAVRFLGSLGTRVIFSSTDGVNGQELWTSDGTNSGTVMIADINPGSANGVTTPYLGTTLNGVFYFPANNGTSGSELWRTDLTSVGTQMVTELGPGSFAGYYTGLTTCGSSRLYFIGNDGTAGYEPYVSLGIVGASPTTTTTALSPTTTTTTSTTTTTTTTTTTLSPTTTTTVAPTTTTTIAPTTTTTIAPPAVVPTAVTTTTAPPTTTTIAKTPYKDWTVSASPLSVSPGEKFSLEVSITCPNKMNNGLYLGDPTGTPLLRYEIKNSSGTSVLGGYAYKGKQVLSNDNFTVTWTQGVVAPTTNGDYTVQVYSTGAAADYIYCKILPMNSRTDGPKTSFSVGSVITTTSTSTTISPSAALPVAGTRPTEVQAWTVGANGNNRVNPGEEVTATIQLKCANTMNSDASPWYPEMYFRLQRLAYDESWPMGVPRAATDQYEPLVVGTESKVMIYSRKITVPSTPGVYTMTAFVRGDARGLATCNFRDGYQTNSWKVNLSIVATATTTTIPPLPVAPEVLQRVNASEPVALVDGKPAAIETVESPASLEVAVDGMVATVGGISESNNPLALTSTGEIRVSNKETVQVSLKGLLPKSQVDVWLYSRDGKEQAYLGSFETSENGQIFEDVKIPSGKLSGGADLLISGTSANGKRVTVGIPMQIVQVVVSNGTLTSITAGLLSAIGGIFVFIVLRRKREDGVAL